MRESGVLVRTMVLWGCVALTLMAFLSNPGLIDGISYFKVAIGIFLMSILCPFIIYHLVTHGTIDLYLILFVCILGLFFFISTDGKNDYRDLFGAPGRSNGF